ncbi:MAG: hypothetical protein ACOC2U_03090 [bacterium]
MNKYQPGQTVVYYDPEWEEETIGSIIAVSPHWDIYVGEYMYFINREDCDLYVLIPECFIRQGGIC